MSDRHPRPAVSHPETIGHALACYREARGWFREQLADWLGVSPTGLAALAIQPRPNPAAPAFTERARRGGRGPGRGSVTEAGRRGPPRPRR